MKKSILIILVILTCINSNAQEDYHGFAISGNTSNNIINNASTTTLGLRNNLSLHYYWNKNNVISFTSKIDYLKTYIDYTSDISIGLNYIYIYWINKRIGVESSVNLGGVGGNEINLNFQLAAVTRLTNSLELTYNLTRVNLYSTTQTSTNSSTTTASNFPGTIKSTTLRIPNSVFTSIGFRYRIPSFNDGLNPSGYIPKTQRKFGIKISFSKNKTITPFVTSFGVDEVKSTDYKIGLGYIINPFSKVNYAINLNYRDRTTYSENIFSNEFSETKQVEINTMVRKNFFYADGFGIFMQGGPLIGRTFGSSKSFTMGFLWEAGFTYIIKDRIMIDGTLSNMSFRRSKSEFQKIRTLQFDPFSLAKISGTVLF